MTNPSPPDATGPDVVAAGAVVTRKGPEGREVLLVHRPKYDDWSFPKGKQDPGEHVTATAVREVLEETGVEIRLGRPLRPQLYAVSGGRAKTVHYWVGHVVGDDDVSSYEINDEVDDLAWLSESAAKERMTYLDDIDLLDQFHESRKTTSALLVVRHAKAEKRDRWDGPDPKRPLNELGRAQAEAMIPMLHAYGVARVITSTSTRCVQTVRPYADRAGAADERDRRALRGGLRRDGGRRSPVRAADHSRADACCAATGRPSRGSSSSSASRRSRWPPARWWCVTTARARSSPPNGTLRRCSEVTDLRAVPCDVPSRSLLDRRRPAGHRSPRVHRRRSTLHLDS